MGAGPHLWKRAVEAVEARPLCVGLEGQAQFPHAVEAAEERHGLRL